MARASRHLSTKSSVIVLSCFIIISFSRLSSSFPVHLVIIQVKWRNEVSYQEDDGHRVLRRMVDCVCGLISYPALRLRRWTQEITPLPATSYP